MKITIACMAKNEASRYWRGVLEVWRSFADRLILLDDNSEDATIAIAREVFGLNGVRVVHRSGDAAWGKESPARKRLYDAAISDTRPGDVIFVLDADMIPARSPRPLFESIDEPGVAFAFSLYDLWSLDPLLYREDNFWYGHQRPRVWAMTRPSDAFEPVWYARGIHCGHFPINIETPRIVCAPRDFSLLHGAYATPELREAKFRQYEAVQPQLSVMEWLHAESILTPNPNLVALPFDPEYELKLEA